MKIKVLAFLALMFCFPCFGQTTVQEWQAKAVAKYPALGISGSPFNKRFIEACTERRNTDPDFFKNPRWPLVLANELALPPAAPPTPTPAPESSATTPVASPTPGAPVAESNPEYEITSIPTSAGLDAARFRWWAPANTQVRGVLVLISGRGGDGRGMTRDAGWQGLATRLQFGILGCMLQNPPDNTGTYQFDPSGLVSDLLDKAIEAELVQNGQTVKNPPLAFWGHSAGGNVTQSYISRHAKRVVGAVLMRAPAGPGDLAPGKEDVPILVFIGKKDKPEWVKSSLENYEKGRADHALWTLALNPNEGHEVGKTQPLAIAHLAAAVELRLPPPALSGQAVKPKPLGKQTGWLADPKTFDVAESSQFKGKKKEAIWLLNEAVAKTWQDYMRGP